MAVEIPVVVDIEKTFEDAASRVPSAMKPLERAVENVDLIPQMKASLKQLESARELARKLREELGGVYAQMAKETSMPFAESEIKRAVDSLGRAEGIASRINFHNQVNDLSEANIQLKQMSAHYDVLERTSRSVSDSINKYKDRLSQLNAEWDSLTSKERNSARGVRIYEEARRVTAALRDEAVGLERMIQKEEEATRAAKKAAEERAAAAEREQERVNALRRKGESSRQYENNILSATTKTMRVLQEQERILSNRLSQSVKGSEKYERLKVQLQRVRQEIEAINRDIAGGTNPALEKTNSRLGMLIKNSIRLLALHSAGRFIRNIREVTSEFELQKVALGSIIQDTERANNLFRQIKAAAIESPFEIKDLVSYTKQLSAYRIETDKLFDVTQRLADVSAGLGVDMGRLILAYGQVRAASVLRGQELRQFTEAGIPLVELLAEKFNELGRKGTTTADVFELISKRAVPFRMIEDIFNDMTSAGGMFYRMQEKQAETLLGQWNNLKDAISIMYDEIGRTESVHKAMTGLINDARWLMLHWRDMARIIKVAGGALLTYVGIAKAQAMWLRIVTSLEVAATAAETGREASIRRVISSIIGKTAAEKISTRATVVHTAALKAAEAATTLFGKSMWRLVAILASNPFGMAAIAVLSLAGAFTTLVNKTQSVEESINKADKSINSLTNARENNALIDRYEELSKKTNRTAKETAALRDISRELGKVFPLTTKAIDNQTGALILNINQMRQYSENAQKTIKDLMEGHITANEAQIKTYEKQQKHIEKVLERGYGFVKGSFYFGLSKDEKNANVLREQLIAASDGVRELTRANQDLRDSINGVQKETTNTNAPYPPIPDGEKLKVLKQQISDITDAYKKFIELRKYMGKEESLKNIATFFPSLAGWEPTYEETVKKLKNMLDQYKGNSEATRIIEQAIANIEFDRVKKSMDDQLKRISDEIKRSETARNFYKSILGVVGDEDLAYSMAVSVYGDTGKDFKERVQKTLADAFESFDASDYELWDKMREAIAGSDFDFILQNIEKFGKEWRDILKQMASDSQKYNAELLKNLADSIAKFGDSSIKISTIKRKTQSEILKIEEAFDLATKDKSDSEVKRMRALADAIIKSLKAIEEIDILKSSEEYVRFFAEVNTLTLKQASDVRTKLRKAYYQAVSAGAIEANQLAKELRAIDKQFEKISRRAGVFRRYMDDGFGGVTEHIRDYADQLSVISEKMKAGKLPDAGEQDFLNKIMSNYKDFFSQFGEESFSGLFDSYMELMGGDMQNALGHLGNVFSGAAEGISSAVGELSGAFRIFDMIVQAMNSMVVSIDGVIDKLNEVRSEQNKIGRDALSWGNFWKLQSESFQEYYSGYEKLKSGDAIGALSSFVRSYISIFNWAQSAYNKAVDYGIKELRGVDTSKYGRGVATLIETFGLGIEGQQELVEQLEYQYGRLENSIRKAFGSDYIADYNKQLEVLYAEQEAYNRMAALERSKGKSSDPEKVKEYENQARDVADQIADMQGQLSEFFSGTDLTSAAKDFASAWIDAYKEFGSTTDAIKEKFNAMIQEMVTNSLAARIMQEILQPLFTQIDEMAADGELSGKEIAAIAAATPKYIEDMNNAMSVLMSGLTAEGYNFRQQVGQFTGIKRNIANATEESVNGLTQAMNVNNFYMSHIPGLAANVAQILAIMSGGTAENPTTGASYQLNNELVLQYMSALPNIDQNIAELLRTVKSVISDKNSASNINVVAVRA